MTRDQLTQAVEGNFLVPLTYAQALFQYIDEKRAADYVMLTPDQAGNRAAAQRRGADGLCQGPCRRAIPRPEYRDADYAVIAARRRDGRQVTVTDAQIQQEYDAHKATYVVPEKRDIQQIEFKTEKPKPQTPAPRSTRA